MAGVTGLDVMRMTHREIVLAYQGRADFEWQQTAEVWAMVANIRQRGKHDRKVYRGTDLYRPYCDREKNCGGRNMSVNALYAIGKKLFGVDKT